jgi:AcrR family transcriptional regulator
MASGRTTTTQRRLGGLVDKRRAILAGALAVFARDGYTRASIDAISAAAGVSTRTIYNHFADKEELFHTVIQESSTRVAEAQVEQIERLLSDVTEIERDLVAFGMAWARPTPEFAEHFALVRQINAEVGHIPQATIEAWQRTGPRRVHRELAYYVRRMAERGLIHTDDPDRSALHLSVLVATVNPSLPSQPVSEEELARVVTAGVRTFLHGHLPARPGE